MLELFHKKEEGQQHGQLKHAHQETSHGDEMIFHVFLALFFAKFAELYHLTWWIVGLPIFAKPVFHHVAKPIFHHVPRAISAVGLFLGGPK